jgi:rhodanese-related sulfurtransferase
MRVFLKYCQLSIMILLMGCSVFRSDTDDKVELISPKEASAMSTGKGAVIVDVRENSEWNEQHIPGAIHIPLAHLNSRLSELKQYKDGPVITQCRSGIRSAQAMEILKSAGFTKVYNMDGGIIAWDKAGLVTE